MALELPRSLKEIQSLIYSGKTTLEEVVKLYLVRIEQYEKLNIYVEVFAEEALEKARELDLKFKQDEKLGMLFGSVISIKDVLCYQDHEVTAGSKILEGFESQYTATAIQRLLDEDAIVIGRTNCDEFAMGSTNENSYYGPTSNGIDPDRVPGGSSGGAAVSVQMDTCLIGIGSDTGGSVRQPAAYCGVIGIKPTYGRISRYGLIAYGSSFDQIGILGKDLEDISLVLHIMSGVDSLDATSAPKSKTPVVISPEKKKYKIAYMPEILQHKGLNQTIAKECFAFIEELKSEGHICEAIGFDLLPYLVPAYYVLTTAEASSNLSRYDGVKYGYRSEDTRDIEELYTKTRTEGFGTEVKRRIMMGTFVLSVGYYEAYFTKAQKVRTLIIDRLKEIFTKYDFIFLPTATDLAPEKGKLVNDPVAMYLSDIFTVMANLGGYPAISIPKSSDALSMPVGMQFLGDKYQEEELITLCMSL